MATATLVRAWTTNGQAYAAARVTESFGDREYIASVPLDDDWNAANTAGKKALLVTALKAVRDQALAAAVITDLGLTGTVTL